MNDKELYHYGVPGMKWGVRKQRQIERSQRKIDKFNRKIAKGNDSKFISRTINDRRRGRVMQIERKRNNRQAKLDYINAKKSGDAKKTEAARYRLTESRINRAKTGAAGYLGISVYRQGRYKENRKAGYSIVRSALTSGAIANAVVNSPRVKPYADRGERIVAEQLKKQLTAD